MHIYSQNVGREETLSNWDYWQRVVEHEEDAGSGLVVELHSLRCPDMTSLGSQVLALRITHSVVHEVHFERTVSGYYPRSVGGGGALDAGVLREALVLSSCPELTGTAVARELRHQAN